MYIVIYVNDLLIAGPNMGAITELKDALSKRFEMSDLGEYRYHLGMEIIRDRPQRTLRLSQKGYVTKILSDFDMQECKPNSTPMAVAHLNQLRMECKLLRILLPGTHEQLDPSCTLC
jgi:hypothetical protein